MISVVVPALNEEGGLAQTVQSLMNAAKAAGGIALDIIVVNDGSTDGTGPLADRLAAENPGVRVIHQPVNRGLGAGWLAALAQAKYPKFMFVPGDNDVSLAMMTELMSHHADADLVLAYFLNKEERGRRRNVISSIYNNIYMVSFNVFIQYITGPAIYSTNTLRSANLKSTRFSIISEATIKSLRSGCSFCEVAGYAQTGKQGSSALSIRNLAEVITGYLRLMWEVHIRQNPTFGRKPRRVRF